MTSLLPALLLVIMCQVTVAVKTCQCTKKSLQDQYCEADFAILVAIKSRKKGGLKYDIEVVTVYRTISKKLYDSANKRLLFVSNKKMKGCPVKFTVGRKYVIAGSFDGSRLTVKACQMTSLWKSLTKYQKVALSRYWRKQCAKCKIRLCKGCRDCYQVPCQKVEKARIPPGTCVLNQANTDWHCFEKYAVCAEVGAGKCSFTETNLLKNCRSVSNPAFGTDASPTPTSFSNDSSTDNATFFQLFYFEYIRSEIDHMIAYLSGRARNDSYYCLGNGSYIPLNATTAGIYHDNVINCIYYFTSELIEGIKSTRRKIWGTLNDFFYYYYYMY